MEYVNWKIKSWSELTTNEFCDIIQLRESVFIVEQNCPYLDVDGKDKSSHHLFIYDNQTLIAYSRLIPTGISYPDSTSIGRVVVNKSYRRNSLARQMMIMAIKHSYDLFDCNKITISAQSYLTNFYQSLGFAVIGEEYLEDDIPHIKMIYCK